MADSPLHKSFLENESISSLSMQVLVAVMAGCLGVGVYMLAQRIIPEWSSSYLPWLSVAVCLEAFLSYRIMRRQTDLNVSPMVYRGIEWMVILISIKLIQYAWGGAVSLLSVITSWQVDFLNNFLTGEYLLVVFFSLCVWLFSTQGASDIDELKGDMIILKDTERDLPTLNRSEVHRHMASRIFIVGFILVIVVALVSMNLFSFIGDPGPSSAGLWILVVYFIAGFSLVSLANFAVLRAGWAREQISIPLGMARRWTGFSLGFLVLVTALAFVLPTSYSLGLLSTLRTVFNVVLGALTGILWFIFATLSIPLTLLINLWQSLFVTTPADQVIIAPPPTQFLGDNAQTPVEWLSFLKSIFFWVILLGVVGYALLQYFRQNQELLSGLRKLPFWSWMVRVWKKLRSGIDQANRSIVILVQAGVERFRSQRSRLQAVTAQRYLSLGRLPPRQKVFFYYLALVRRGAENSLPRKPVQTPYEYARYLESKLPDVREEVESLTEVFMKARYSTQEVTLGDASHARQYWEKLRNFLREFRERNQ